MTMRSLEKTDAIAAHGIYHDLLDGVTDVRRLLGDHTPVIHIEHDNIVTFVGWISSLRSPSVTVGRDQSGVVGTGVIPCPEPAGALPVSVVMTVRPGPMRAAGLVGLITVTDLDVLVGEPVSA